MTQITNTQLKALVQQLYANGGDAQVDALVEDIQGWRNEVAEEAAIVEAEVNAMRAAARKKQDEERKQRALDAAKLKSDADLAEAEIIEHCVQQRTGRPDLQRRRFLQERRIEEWRKKI